ncbi:MAG: TIR domain-containing protein [Reyranella sp.]|jgi:hypothetical protein|nr:TIR domain-containing protein [Reyranella sp.]MBL6652624.1 TIR domain-containing protein [Reyranella sp.]
MTLVIAQQSKPKDESHWSWSVWLEGAPSELDNVAEVIWKLHPTFSPSVVRRDTPANKFKLSSSGWGEFQIVAEVKMKVGRKKVLQHWLKLAEGAPSKEAMAKAATKTPAKQARPTVFLSYSVDNANLASHVARVLQDKEYEVARDIDIPAGVSIQDWTKEQIAKSDAVIVLGAEQTSLYQTREAAFAQSAGKPVIRVATGKITKDALAIEGAPVKFVRAGTGSPETVALNLVQKIDKIL